MVFAADVERLTQRKNTTEALQHEKLDANALGARSSDLDETPWRYEMVAWKLLKTLLHRSYEVEVASQRLPLQQTPAKNNG